MQVSPHFDGTEFSHGTTIPEECFPLLRQFCAEVLEPIRAYIHRSMEITSGYRSADSNAAAHGVKDSEHIWTPRRIAADFTFNTTFGTMLSMRATFDWIRSSPTLPFHQLVLEHGRDGTSIIHISMNLDESGKRVALEGSEHNASPYTSWEVVGYTPSSGTAGKENG